MEENVKRLAAIGDAYARSIDAAYRLSKHLASLKQRHRRYMRSLPYREFRTMRRI